MRLTRLLLALALPLTVAAADPTPPGNFVELYQAALKAHEAKDYATMEQKLRDALKVRPGHPATTYNLAAALALKGDAKESLKTLESLVRMGLSYDPSKDADFASLARSERFADVNKDFARNARPAGRTRTVFQGKQRPDLIPEGLAYDDEENRYYLGSVHRRLIQRAKAGETPEAFIPPGAGSMWSPLGMVADEERHLLWVASAAIPEGDGIDPKDYGKSAILAFDTRTGDAKRRYVLDAPGEHLLGDLTVARNGTIYATDTKAGLLYSLDTTSGKFEALTKPGELVSPQGVVQAQDRNILFVADYTQGLFRYEIRGKKLTRIEPTRDICLYGIDGLARYKDMLVAVQNGVRPHRIVQLELDNRARRVLYARVLASNQPYFDEPTLGVVIGDHFDFVANSQWNKFNEQHQLPPDDQLKNPLVLRVELSPARSREDPFDSNQGQPVQQQDSRGLLGTGVPCIGPAC